MNPAKIMPCLLIALHLGSAVVYATSGQWWKVLYWTAGAAITIAVTFDR